jgi:iron complex outermembrane receptor protein
LEIAFPSLPLVLAVRIAALMLSGIAAGAANAQALLDPVVVSAGRTEQRSFDAPAAIQSIDAATVRDAGPGFQVSESLSRIPGVTALDRQNWAQDPQLSIRGFGARASFGIRGLRILVDGIPATMPDGQGQASAIDLAATRRIEVLRGPLAQLHGNAAGGVLQVFSRTGGLPPAAGGELGFGSFGARRQSLSASGQAGGVSAALDTSWLAIDGWRVHSAAERRQLNANFGTTTAAGTRITLVASDFDQPEALDPGGLNRAQVAADPRQASLASIAQGSRKTVAQRQAGLVLEHALDRDRRLSARVYGGERDVFQALGLSPAAQRPPGSAGGIVALDRRYGGVGLQYAHAVSFAASRLEASVGIEAEGLAETRRGFENLAGAQGALRRDEENTARSNDAYAQLAWTTGAWTLLGGLRASRIAFEVADAYVAPGNPDDSGRRRYDAVNPVAGLTWHASDTLNLYANLGRGFETPTFAELAYVNRGSGLNLGLQASRSTHAELGAKWLVSPLQRLDVALFRTGTDDEIVVDVNAGGRSTFRNAGRSRRRGIEIAWLLRPAPAWRAQVAATLLDAHFVDGFGAGAAAVAAGRRIPGVPDRRVFAELAWEPDPQQGPFAGFELLHTGRIQVDDRNSDSAAPSTVTALRAGWRHRVGPWRFAGSLRLDNLADTDRIGSVIVNESQQRFFEPAPGRSWFAGMSVERVF